MEFRLKGTSQLWQGTQLRLCDQIKHTCLNCQLNHGEFMTFTVLIQLTRCDLLSDWLTAGQGLIFFFLNWVVSLTAMFLI